MSYPVLTSALLIEASGAALNNAGSQPGERLSNAVVVKQIRVGRDTYPYISGQAVRRWWREVLYQDFGWTPSPVTRTASSAYTLGDPVRYEDDDLFGYMAAKKAAKKSGKKDAKQEATETEVTLLPEEETAIPEETGDAGGTQRRVSPLKNSLFVSVLPNVIKSDFGHFSRDLPVDDARMVPFEHEHYTTWLQGTFCLSLMDVGRFECGAMRDLPATATPEGVSLVQDTDSRSVPRTLALPAATRRHRAAQLVDALGRLRYGANLTRNLSDVVPVVCLFGLLDGGNAPFQNIFTSDSTGKVSLNLARLQSVVSDYAERLLDNKTLYFGYRPGVLANEAEVVRQLEEGYAGVSFVLSSPGDIIRQVSKRLRESAVVPESLL